jgi:hypothetical protein
VRENPGIDFLLGLFIKPPQGFCTDDRSKGVFNFLKTWFFNIN